MTHYVVQISGGAGSYFAARRTLETHGKENVTLLFADTRMEDEDLYRFLDDCEADLDHPITRITEGRDPWEVFEDVKFIGNTRIDPCSKILKRDFLREWVEANRPDPDDTVLVIGIDWTEQHRFEQAKPRFEPYKLEAPLCEPPYMDKQEMLDGIRERGIEVPRLYDMGFQHNNCGGFCIKAGQANFKLLLEKMPERFDYHAAKEQEMRKNLGKDVSILRDRTLGGILGWLGITEDDIEPVYVVKGEATLKLVKDSHVHRGTWDYIPTTRPLPLTELKERVQGGVDHTDPNDHGGCGCAL